MKHFLFVFVSLFLFSCAAKNKAPRQTPLERKMNAYIGKSKAEIMLVYGHAPVKDGWIDGLGRALVYTNIKSSGFGVYSQQYYEHTMFILNQDMRCIAWSVRNEQMPFDRLDVRIFRN